MIDPKELRIGNWINSDAGICEVCDLDFGRINGIYLDNDRGEYDFWPIPLTPEILEKCGFKYQGNSSKWWILEGVESNIYLQEVAGQKPYALFASEWTIGKSFSNLHELQNICFCLFGQELTVNL